jgi:hypothetical protein
MEIQKLAREMEKARDEKSDEANHLLHAHHWFAYSVALLQVAITLGAVGALTRSRIIWIFSLVAGTGATLLFILALLR